MPGLFRYGPRASSSLGRGVPLRGDIAEKCRLIVTLENAIIHRDR